LKFKVSPPNLILIRNILKVLKGKIMNAEDKENSSIDDSNNNPDQAASNNSEDQIKLLEEKLAETQAQVLYVKAEGENIRKRSFEDIDKARKFALEKFSGELLSVKDSLDAALTIENANVDSYKNGVELTQKQLINVFEKFGIHEIKALGEKFDPNQHQAISMVESEEEPNKILTVLQKGYLLNERVIRPALVTVSKTKNT
jgi:molecular chaperone GrpE